jgi:hypothetical protein
MRALCGVVLGLMFVSQSAAAQSVTITSSSPTEAKLASIDARSTTVQQTTIAQYARLLDSLDRKCKENRTQIGDFAAKGVQLLAEKKHVKMTHLKFLQSMDGSMPQGSETLNLSCAEVAAMLVTMIERP